MTIDSCQSRRILAPARDVVILAACFVALVTPLPGAAAEPLFRDLAAATGLDFVHFSGISGELYFVEIAGPGVGVLDFDNDGDLDIYLPQGEMLGPAKTEADAQFPRAPGAPRGDRLFRNDLAVDAEGQRVLTFRDVTEASGIRARGYAMGVATGDYDNDGRVDLYVTNFGANQLWHNDGDGTFTDMSERAGVEVGTWSVSATFVDYDRDGWLDLYVGNYVDFSIQNHKPCYTTSSARDYCGPRSYNPLPDRLFHNRGDGTFEEVSAAAGIAVEYGAALGVSSADFDLDGWPDIYVANDQTSNQLWVNQKDGRFVNDALLAGAAVNMDGAPEASMGVDVADFDGDGDEDIFLTHLNRQTNTIYVNQGNGWFSDETLVSGLATPSFSYTSFGTAWIDYDNDGWLDLLIVNGDVQIIESLALAGDPFPLHQPNQLFRHVEGGRFEDVTASAGPVFELSEVSRGAAFGDLDNDGDTDVVVANNSGPVRLLLNEVGNRNSWLGLRLLDPVRQRDAIGARVAVSLDDGRTLWRRVRTDGSYASANDPRVLVGLGVETAVEQLRVVWPDGTVEVFPPVPLRTYTTLRQGDGEADNGTEVTETKEIDA